MSVIVTFEDYYPPPRYDDLPWTEARVYEAETSDGEWTLIDTVELDPVDSDPEHPISRGITTENGTALGLWYQIVFADATDDTSQPTTPVQNTGDADSYATVSELARILKLTNPSAAQTVAMQRVLTSAAGEINTEIDLGDDDDPLSGWKLSLAAEVNLERAVELWRLEETAFGIVGLGSEFGASHIARNTWDKYAYTLAPLKTQWGLA